MSTSITQPTEDFYGGTYKTVHEMAQALALTERQFYGLLHAAVLRNDTQVRAWDDKEATS